MTTQALVSRQATANHDALALRQASHDDLLTRAKMLAKCPPEMLPKQYRGNVGACLLLVDWSDRNDVSMLEAMGQVGFAFGKPVIEATLQKRMAARHGYRTQLLSTDPEAATVAVYGPDNEMVGEPVTYTWELAQEYGIHYDTKNRKTKDAWSTPAKRAHMLVKRATTRALEYYGPSELAPLMVDVSDDDPEIVGSPQEPSQSPPPDGSDAVAPETPDTDAEVVPPTEDELRKQLKAKKLTVAAAMRAAQDMHPDASGTLADIAANTEAAFDLEDWIRQQ